MGDYAIGYIAKIFGWFSLALMAASSVALLTTGGISI
jgi:hypothetical protein